MLLADVTIRRCQLSLLVDKSILKNNDNWNCWLVNLCDMDYYEGLQHFTDVIIQSSTFTV